MFAGYVTNFKATFEIINFAQVKISVCQTKTLIVFFRKKNYEIYLFILACGYGRRTGWKCEGRG